MNASILWHVIVFFFGAVVLCADVTISEISGRTPERLLKWSSDGQPSLGPGTAWFESEFDDHTWTGGTAPFGFGYDDITTDLAKKLQETIPSFYLRQTFTATAEQAASGTSLQLEVEYDDGFIAYLNGKEIARRNMGSPQMFIYSDQVAFNSGNTTGNPETIVLGPASSLLSVGENVLAVHVANGNVSTSIRFDTDLRIGGDGEPLVADSEWTYTTGQIEPSGGVFEPAFLDVVPPALTVEWGKLDFDESTWLTGEGPLGIEAGSGYTLGTNLVAEIRNVTPSLFLRKEFEVTAAQLGSASSLQLTVDYDDGYIIYLNGAEVARGTMGAVGTFVPHNAPSSGGHGASTDGGGNATEQIVTLSLDKNLLHVGTNILAAQVHNAFIGSSDLLLDTTLETEGELNTTLFTSTGDWRYFVGLSEPSALPGPLPEPPVAEFSDWIELHNGGASPVDLTGWTLSDDSSDPTKWPIPAGTTIGADGYLLVLADEQTDSGIETNYLHANFKLSRGGEFLGLFDNSGIVRDQFSPEFPQQLDFQSFGTEPGGEARGYLETPTPGSPNTGTFYAAEVAKPDFDVPGGFHASTVTLNITTTTPGATIRYTIDGAEPTAESTIYEGPLILPQIDLRTGHAIRARAFAIGMVPSTTRSATFLIDQANNIRQAPAMCFTADEERSLYGPYGIMAIEGGQYVGQFWQPINGDDYNVALLRGRSVERPAFIEYYFADTTIGFRQDAGIRYSGSDYSRPRMRFEFLEESPWLSNFREKPSFNIFFRNEYDNASVTLPIYGQDYPVDTFEQLRPRAGKNDIRNPFIRDELVRRLYIDMGQIGSRGVFNSLYVNGQWKGYYNTCERLREPFFQAHYGGGEWDIRQAGNPSAIADGDLIAWDDLNARLQAANVGDKAAWDHALELVDPIAVADYFLVNIYGATRDWPNNNYVTARQRSPEGRFRFYVWDAEGAFAYNPKDHDTIQNDLLSSSGSTSLFFQRLERWPEFKLIMADRIQRHFFNGGTLDTSTPTNSRVREIIDECVDEFEPLNIERGHGTVNLDFWNHWTAAPSRRSYLLGGTANYFRDAGYWPVTGPPGFNQHGGDVPADFQLTLSNGNNGTIYYTLDGSDPREFGGTVSSSALVYSSPLTLVSGFTAVKARVLSSSGEWSALTESEFRSAILPAAAGNLVVAEFLYNPIDASPAELDAGFTDKDDFEFIQLLNTGEQLVDLSEVDFADGINFDFGSSAIQVIESGAYVIVVSNLAAFQQRYGSAYDTIIAGEYDGQLSNSGERVVLSGPDDTTLHDFTYDDKSPWSFVADGFGVSLRLADPKSNPDHAVASNWVASAQLGGTPGGVFRSISYEDWRQYFFNTDQLADSLISGASADPDNDDLPNLLEFVTGGLPGIFDPEGASFEMVAVEDGYEISVQVLQNLTDVEIAVEISSDLDWSSLEEVQELEPIDHADGTTTRTFLHQTSTNLERRFARVRVILP